MAWTTWSIRRFHPSTDFIWIKTNMNHTSTGKQPSLDAAQCRDCNDYTSSNPASFWQNNRFTMTLWPLCVNQLGFHHQHSCLTAGTLLPLGHKPQAKPFRAVEFDSGRRSSAAHVPPLEVHKAAVEHLVFSFAIDICSCSWPCAGEFAHVPGKDSCTTNYLKPPCSRDYLGTVKCVYPRAGVLSYCKQSY